MKKSTIYFFLVIIILQLSSCTKYILPGKVVYSEGNKSLVSLYASNRSVWINKSFSNGTVLELETKSLDNIKPKIRHVLCDGNDVHCHFGSSAHIRTHIKVPTGASRIISYNGNQYSNVSVKDDGETQNHPAWLLSTTYNNLTLPIHGHVIYLLEANGQTKAEILGGHVIMDLNLQDGHH